MTLRDIVRPQMTKLLFDITRIDAAFVLQCTQKYILLRPEQYCWIFSDHIFKCIFLTQVSHFVLHFDKRFPESHSCGLMWQRVTTLEQVMTWYHQTLTHYLNQCWPMSMTPYGHTGGQWTDQKEIFQGNILTFWAIYANFIIREQHFCVNRTKHWWKILATFVWGLNILRPSQHGRHFADDTFKRFFLNENVRISIKISLKFVPKGPINNIPALVQIMAWRRPGAKLLSEPMMVCLLTYIFRVTGHLCGEFTGPRWIPRTKASDAELWYFLWSASE